MDEYLCQLLSNRSIIGCLYNELDKSSVFLSENRIGYFKFSYPSYGSKTYSSNELLILNNQSVVNTLAELFADLNLDNIVKIFFKGRNQIGGLYCARIGSYEFRTTSTQRFFNFVNPYQGFIDVSPASIRISFCEILKLDCRCGGITPANIFDFIS